MLSFGGISANQTFSNPGQQHEFIVRADGLKSYVEIDWDGDSDADFRIEITNINNLTVPFLTTADFRFHRIQGSSGADTFYGTDLDDTLKGLGGANTLYGNKGDDTLVGGGGADTLIGGEGSDRFVFENMTDSSRASHDRITGFSQDQDDKLALSFTQEIVFNGTGSFSGTNNELIITTISGDTFVEIDWDGDGNTMPNDTGDFRLELDNFTGLTSNDFLFRHVTGTSGADTFQGDDQDSTLKGGDGNDTLYGNAGDDRLIGGIGGDTLVGGKGDDRIYADNEQFTNTSINGLQLWLDASDINADGSALSDGNTIATWVDKSGLNNHATQVTGYQQARVDTDGLNGVASVNFDGSNDYFNLPDGTVPYGNSNYTVFTIINTSTNYNVFLSSGSRGGGRSNSFGITSNWQASNYWFHNDFNSQSISANSDTLLTFDYDGSRRELWIDNGSWSSRSSSPRASHATHNFLGKEYRNTRYWDDDLAEILVFNNALSTDDRNYINNLLGYKYGLSQVVSLTPDTLTGGEGDDIFVWTNNAYSSVSNADIITDFKANDDNDKIELSFDQQLVFGGNAFTGVQNELIIRNDGTHTYVEIDWDGDGSSAETTDFRIKLENFTDPLDMSDFIFHRITADNANNLIQGTELDDKLDGAGGADTLSGGLGNDQFIWSDTTHSIKSNSDVITDFNASDDKIALLFDEQLVFGGNTFTGVHNELITYTSGSDSYVAIDLDGDGAMDNSEFRIKLENFTGTLDGSHFIFRNITATSANETITGSHFDDTLAGGAGSDTIKSLAGDDTIIYDSSDLTGSTLKIDGGINNNRLGAGDILELSDSGQHLDLTSINNSVIQNIEIIQLDGTGDNSLTVSINDVLDLSSTTDDLFVTGDSGDSVTLDTTNGTWTQGTSQTINNGTHNYNYHVYTGNSATIYIESAINLSDISII